ncbi:MAG: hypothetical protein WAT39_21700 [Planctomycetota bacterium]
MRSRKGRRECAGFIFFTMKPRLAILLDGAFVLKRLSQELQRRPDAAEVLDLCSRIRGQPALAGLDLLRVYWYDAPPATGTIANPVTGQKTNLGQSDVYRWATSLHEKIEMQPDFALRMGEVSVHPTWRIAGWEPPSSPASSRRESICVSDSISRAWLCARWSRQSWSSLATATSCRRSSSRGGRASGSISITSASRRASVL